MNPADTYRKHKANPKAYNDKPFGSILVFHKQKRHIPEQCSKYYDEAAGKAVGKKVRRIGFN